MHLHVRGDLPVRPPLRPQARGFRLPRLHALGRSIGRGCRDCARSGCLVVVVRTDVSRRRRVCDGKFRQRMRLVYRGRRWPGDLRAFGLRIGLVCAGRVCRGLCCRGRFGRGHTSGFAAVGRADEDDGEMRAGKKNERRHRRHRCGEDSRHRRIRGDEDSRHRRIRGDERVHRVRDHRHDGSRDKQRPRVPGPRVPVEGNDGDRGDHDQTVDQQRPHPRLSRGDPGPSGEVGERNERQPERAEADQHGAAGRRADGPPPSPRFEHAHIPR